MKKAIIIHGMPEKEEYYNIEMESPSNCHWIPWLQKQLNINNILTQTPEMPEPFIPDYEKWKKVFEQFNIDENTILIGHSCGGGFLVKWLSETKININKLILVAPWINYEKESETTMFDDLNIDENLIAKTKGITIFSSDNDMWPVQKSIEVLKEKIKNIKVIEFHNYGHFCLGGDMKTREFPELLDEILN